METSVAEDRFVNAEQPAAVLLGQQLQLWEQMSDKEKLPFETEAANIMQVLRQKHWHPAFIFINNFSALNIVKYLWSNC